AEGVQLLDAGAVIGAIKTVVARDGETVVPGARSGLATETGAGFGTVALGGEVSVAGFADALRELDRAHVFAAVVDVTGAATDDAALLVPGARQIRRVAE